MPTAATSSAASPPEAPLSLSPRRVLRRMGIEATRLRLIARGHNVHWLAERGGRVVASAAAGLDSGS